MTESLRDILGKLKAIDDDLAPEDFDPAAIVGDLADKVDAIKWRIDSWYAEADMIETEWIAQLISRADSLKRKAEKLEDYAKTQMLVHNYEKLPGVMFRLHLQNNSTPSTTFTRKAQPEDYFKHPEFVSQKITYDWMAEPVKDAITAGTELDFASLERGKHIRFYVNKKEKK